MAVRITSTKLCYVNTFSHPQGLLGPLFLSLNQLHSSNKQNRQLIATINYHAIEYYFIECLLLFNPVFFTE